ncbi:alpha/beta fold hydrolase [Streptomyces sp. AcE210]|uniref:esterase/lipase family protein n=1 Tax=Streptomyces sp. AcE210 TaxID=2292703 RepID=UPI001404D549|nr:alpha/beta fold hydrolase [Streptomyces sp. AcE210]
MNRHRNPPPAGRRVRAFGAALVTLVVTALLGPASTASAAGEPSLNTPAATLDAALHCPSSFTHPDHEPVLLVHGFSSTYDESWGFGYVPALRDAGYDVCGVDLPGRAMGDIQDSTEYVVHAIDKINSATGRKVDVVGHSEGTLAERWAVKWWPHLQNEVDDMVTVAGPAHGISGGNLLCVLPCVPALSQFSIASKFIGALNGGDETPGPISYTNVYSVTDEAITPFTTAPIDGAKNVAVQSVCPGRVVAHFQFLYDALTYRLVVDALSHSGAADPDRLPSGKCLEVNLPGVSAGDATAATAVVVANFNAALLTSPVTWAEPPLRSYAAS